MADRKRFLGFISYSQRDKAEARRLHAWLENYRVPKGLVGGLDESRRLGRFFRDDDEMGAAADLGAALRGAIADADSLIVLCSPHSAASKWVNAEITHFRETGRGGKVFAVIVDGVPNSNDAKTECFPPALRMVSSAPASEAMTIEPLAIDVRKDGRARASTRLVAGLLDISFDALWRREQRRRRARAVGISLMTLLVALGLGAAATQNAWYPKLGLWWRYERLAHDVPELIAATSARTFQDCRPASPDCPVMVILPAGRFMMGSKDRDLESEDDETPMHPVSIARFAVSQHEITFDDWQVCFRAGGCPAAPDDNGFGGGSRPVINVTWYEAERYARWLSAVTKKRYRLLSEAEWEYAARGLTDLNAPNVRYPWGDADPTCTAGAANGAAFYDCLDQRTYPVGSFKPNAFGLYDMAGNVWEWVEDCFHDRYNVYSGAPADGSAWDTDCDEESGRTARGGAWDQDASQIRAAKRASEIPGERYNNIGFRVARTP